MQFGNREVDNIVLSKVNHDDYPRYVDAFVESANFTTGKPLTNGQCRSLTIQMHKDGTMQELCADLLQWE